MDLDDRGDPGEHPCVPEVRRSSLDRPVDTVQFEKITIEEFHVGELSIARTVLQPGYRWRDHTRPIVGGDWCEGRHVGVVLAGRFGVHLQDGSTVEFDTNDIYDVPPFHDTFTIGAEPCVQLDWLGMRTFMASRLLGSPHETLATLLLTDIVDSTTRARELGERAWLNVLSAHFEMIRSLLQRYRGHEVQTTGDGMLATFDGPATALRCAADIRRSTARDGLQIRAGVHIGEVDFLEGDVRGIAVHEVARIAGEAVGDEILVSEVTRALASSSQLQFRTAGVRTLKGLPGEWELFEFIDDPVVTDSHL
jgi:class 3 adenylate cyclase